ncbi:MAG: radical SAM protein [Dehalococcoidales bacterium]|nr:radical SAM protein [Dehalococcoidales bacterium]
MRPERSRNTGYYRSACRLLFNGCKFRCSRFINRPLKPTVLSLALTGRCNSHCIMCNIWKQARENPETVSRELSAQAIIDLLSNPLFSELVELDLTGGEPHLRDDLVDIGLGITRLKSSSLPRLRSVIITSNGFLTGKIISDYRDILRNLKNTDIDLVSVISIDGIGATHDKVRGTKNAYKMATTTLDRLVELKKEYPGLIPGIKTTILPQNIDALDDILNFAITRHLFYIISPAFFTEKRFRNLNRRDELALSPTEYKKVLNFFNRDELKTGYYYDTARRFLATGRRQWACTALFNYLFIDFDGKIYPCEIMPEPIGDLKQQDIRDIWASPRSQAWRKRIGKSEYCQTCHEPGAIRYSAFTEGLSYFKFLNQLGRKVRSESLHGEGYIKYSG